MSKVADTLSAISAAGLMLAVDEAREILKVYPAKNISPELATAIKEHKTEIVRIVCEDEEMCRTGLIQSERQVFEIAREYFDLKEKGGVKPSPYR